MLDVPSSCGVVTTIEVGHHLLILKTGHCAETTAADDAKAAASAIITKAAASAIINEVLFSAALKLSLLTLTTFLFNFVINIIYFVITYFIVRDTLIMIYLFIFT